MRHRRHLVEAGLVGAKVIGIDAQEKLVVGARMNLEAFGLDYVLMEGDACRIPFKEATIDAIVTDPPYGRSAAILAESLEKLYSCSLKEIQRVLKPGGIAVVVSDKDCSGIRKKCEDLRFLRFMPREYIEVLPGR